MAKEINLLVAAIETSLKRKLELSRNYFPGYAVTWPGVLVGLLYGALVGAIVGWSTAWIYNLMVDIRHGRRT